MKASYKFLLSFLFVIVVAGGGYYAWHSHANSNGLANISDAAKLSDDQVNELIARVSNFLVLPTDERPSVVVIKDVATLASQQTFYKDAKDGDILLVYSSRAIIYDVKANKLVNVGPIVRNDNPPTDGTASASAGATPSPSPSGSVSPTPTPVAITVDVRNGTPTAGLAGTTASTIKKNKLFTIGVVGDAKGTYTATVIVDFTTSGSAKAAAVQELAKLLSAKVVTELPTGETKGTADALVIVGK